MMTILDQLAISSSVLYLYVVWVLTIAVAQSKQCVATCYWLAQSSGGPLEKLGHEFNKLGALVYCSPWFNTAISYARPQNVFGDGVYHMCALELRVGMTQRHKQKAQGGKQWAFPPAAVIITGVWVCHNCGNVAGEEHLRYWEAEDECIPLQCEQVHVLPSRLGVWFDIAYRRNCIALSPHHYQKNTVV